MKHYLAYNRINSEEIGLGPGIPRIQAALKIDGGKWDIQILQPKEKDKAQVAYGIIDKFLRENYLESIEEKKLQELLADKRAVVAKIAMSPSKNCFILKFDPNVIGLERRKEFYRDKVYEINERIKDFGEIVGEHIIKEADACVVVFQDYKEGLKSIDDFRQAGVTMKDMERLEDNVAGLLNTLFSTSVCLSKCSVDEIFDYTLFRCKMYENLPSQIERILNQKEFGWLSRKLRRIIRKCFDMYDSQISHAEMRMLATYVHKERDPTEYSERFRNLAAYHIVNDFVHGDLCIPYNAFPPKEFLTDNKAKLAIIDVNWGGKREEWEEVPKSDVRPIVADYTKVGVSLLDLENEIFNFKETSEIDAHIARIDKKFFSEKFFIFKDEIHPEFVYKVPELLATEFDFHKLIAAFSEVVYCRNKKERPFWNRFTKSILKKMIEGGVSQR